MEHPTHSLAELFEQLGLPSDSNAIEGFIARHRPVARDLALDEAPFWTETQRAFLRDSRDDDADWAELVDSLSARLH